MVLTQDTVCGLQLSCRRNIRVRAVPVAEGVQVGRGVQACGSGVSHPEAGIDRISALKSPFSTMRYLTESPQQLFQMGVPRIEIRGSANYTSTLLSLPIWRASDGFSRDRNQPAVLKCCHPQNCQKANEWPMTLKFSCSLGSNAVLDENVHGSLSVLAFSGFPKFTAKEPCLCVTPKLGCCWDTFCIFAYCGLVGNPPFTAFFFLPFQRQPRKHILLHPPSSECGRHSPQVGLAWLLPRRRSSNSTSTTAVSLPPGRLEGFEFAKDLKRRLLPSRMFFLF